MRAALAGQRLDPLGQTRITPRWGSRIVPAAASMSVATASTRAHLAGTTVGGVICWAVYRGLDPTDMSSIRRPASQQARKRRRASRRCTREHTSGTIELHIRAVRRLHPCRADAVRRPVRSATGL